MKKHDQRVECPICRTKKHTNEVIPRELIREQVIVEINGEHPEWNAGDVICFSCVNRYRAVHVQRLLEQEKGELTSLEEQVVASIREQEAISENINEQFDQQLTFAESLSDRIAAFGGSWTFIIAFGIVMMLWIGINTIILYQKPFDPFPFILLNLVLSFLAAMQAPVIMMSQNRQEAKDRMRSEHDYRVNLKAELEVRLLNTKVDQLLTHQWQRLLEIQQLQVELLEEVANRQSGSPRTPQQGV